MMDLIDVLDGPLALGSELIGSVLPGASLLYKWGARLTGKLSAWWESRGSKVLSKIEHLQPEQLLEQLPSYLGIDICDGIKENPTNRPIVFFDTYEALWRGRNHRDGLDDRRIDSWVRLLIQDAPGVLFVIAGRDKLRWAEIDIAWKDVMDLQPLSELSDHDANVFLENAPIVEEDIRTKIIESAEGLPFFLDLQVSHYEALLEQDKIPLTDYFGGTSSDILARFLEHLNETDRNVLHVASYLESITKETMGALVENFPALAQNYSFEQMISRSSFQEISEGVYEIHQLMKEELQRREKFERENQFIRAHKYLQKYHEQYFKGLPPQMDPKEGISHFSNAFHHLVRAERKQAASWLLENNKYLEHRHAWTILEEMYDVTIETTEADVYGNKDLYYLKNNLGMVYDNLGFIEKSIVLYKEILADSNTSDKVPYLVEATASNNLAQVYQHEGELASAWKLFKRCESILAKDGSKYANELATVSAAKAENLFLQSRHSEALPLFLSTASSLASRGLLLSSSTLTSMICENLQVLGLNDTALAIHFKTVELFVRCEISGVETINQSVSIEPESIPSFQWSTTLSDIMWSRTKYEYASNIFDQNVCKLDLFSKQIVAQREFITDDDLISFFNDIRPTEYTFDSGIQHHPHQAELAASLESMLLKTNIGEIFLKVCDHCNAGPVFYTGNYFDVVFFEKSSKILVVLPGTVVRLEMHHIAVIILEMRRADIILSGHSPPEFRKGWVSHAGYYHARNVECLMSLSRFVNEHGDEEKQSYTALFVEKYVDFIAQQQKGASKELLYDLYAESTST